MGRPVHRAQTQRLGTVPRAVRRQRWGLLDASGARAVLGASLMSFGRPFLILSIILIGACGTKELTAEEVLAQDAPKIEPKMVALEKIVQNLPAATGTIKLAGPPLDLIGTADAIKTGNAAFAYEAD